MTTGTAIGRIWNGLFRSLFWLSITGPILQKNGLKHWQIYME